MQSIVSVFFLFKFAFAIIISIACIRCVLQAAIVQQESQAHNAPVHRRGGAGQRARLPHPRGGAAGPRRTPGAGRGPAPAGARRHLASGQQDWTGYVTDRASYQPNKMRK